MATSPSPAGQQADAVVVTGGTATIPGDVRTLFVFDGHAVLQGARVETVVVTGGTLAIDAGTTVTGDIRTLNTTVTQDPAATVGGTGEDAWRRTSCQPWRSSPRSSSCSCSGLGLVTLVAALALAALGATAGSNGRGLSARSRSRPSCSGWRPDGHPLDRDPGDVHGHRSPTRAGRHVHGLACGSVRRLPRGCHLDR